MAKDKIPESVLEYFRKQGKRGGKLSAKARMAKLTPEERSAVARKAAAASAAVRSKKALENRQSKAKPS